MGVYGQNRNGSHCSFSLWAPPKKLLGAAAHGQVQPVNVEPSHPWLPSSHAEPEGLGSLCDTEPCAPLLYFEVPGQLFKFPFNLNFQNSS